MISQDKEGEGQTRTLGSCVRNTKAGQKFSDERQRPSGQPKPFSYRSSAHALFRFPSGTFIYWWNVRNPWQPLLYKP